MSTRQLFRWYCLAMAVLGHAILIAPQVVAFDDTAPTSEVDDKPTIDGFLRQSWAKNGIVHADRCSDEVFVRRLYLDLAGRIPTPEEVSDFLQDDHPARRTRLVDAVLASEDHYQHMADVFDTLLMGRVDSRKYAERDKHQWRGYLESVFRENRPWNDVVREILLARPEDKERQGALWFLYERNNEYQEIAEAVAPAFFGIRIECAQCHDHMLVEEIHQQHYWGLVAFFNRGKNKSTKNGLRVVESAVGGFSEFADLSGDSSPNLLTFIGASQIDEERPASGEEQKDDDSLYITSDVDGEPRVPMFSRRQRFVDDVVANHPMVARAMVNRLWAIMMGRGIVHPFDEMDSIHEPDHPELLDWLAKDFESGGFRIRKTLRQIALSDAYQRDSVQPEGIDEPSTFAWYLERPLTAEQLARSIHLAIRGEVKSDSSLRDVFRVAFPDVLPDEALVTIDEALFLSNGKHLSDFLAASAGDGHLVHRTTGLATHAERINSIFQAVLSRSPDQRETEVIEDYLRAREDSLESAVQQVIWSLITSAEFRFNH